MRELVFQKKRSHFPMNSVLVLLKEVVLQKEIVFTQVCVYLKKKNPHTKPLSVFIVNTGPEQCF